MASFYSDLDFNFFANPVTDDVAKKIDDNAIKQSLKNLVLLRKYECPFHPEVHSQISDSLFENITPLTDSILQRAITYTIENFEPRIELLGVNVDSTSKENTLYITIKYRIVANGAETSYSFAINRTR